jgi:hypothetical protein
MNSVSNDGVVGAGVEAVAELIVSHTLTHKRDCIAWIRTTE